MVTSRNINALAAEIARRFSPVRIVLFGSQAWGTPNADSEVDLLVILSGRVDTLQMEFEIRQSVHPEFPVDILVHTPSEIAKRVAIGDFFLRDIMTKGLVLHEATHAGCLLLLR